MAYIDILPIPSIKILIIFTDSPAEILSTMPDDSAHRITKEPSTKIDQFTSVRFLEPFISKCKYLILIII